MAREVLRRRCAHRAPPRERVSHITLRSPPPGRRDIGLISDKVPMYRFRSDIDACADTS